MNLIKFPFKKTHKEDNLSVLKYGVLYRTLFVGDSAAINTLYEEACTRIKAGRFAKSVDMSYACQLKQDVFENVSSLDIASEYIDEENDWVIQKIRKYPLLKVMVCNHYRDSCTPYFSDSGADYIADSFFIGNYMKIVDRQAADRRPAFDDFADANGMWNYNFVFPCENGRMERRIEEDYLKELRSASRFFIKDGELSQYYIKNEILRYGLADRVVVPDGVTMIGERACSTISCFKHIELPDSLEMIEAELINDNIEDQTISRPRTFLQTEERFPKGIILKMLQSVWKDQVSLTDFVYLYVFQPEKQLTEYCLKQLEKNVRGTGKEMAQLANKADCKTRNFVTMADFIEAHLREIDREDIKSVYEAAVRRKEEYSNSPMPAKKLYEAVDRLQKCI